MTWILMVGGIAFMLFFLSFLYWVATDNHLMRVITLLSFVTCVVYWGIVLFIRFVKFVWLTV